MLSTILKGQRKKKKKHNKPPVINYPFREALANELGSLDNTWELLDFPINIYMENTDKDNASYF